ncbi:MAG: zinc ribbon domain-containing protein [Acetatifactor sp.]|nr:zinc ribbon domain-containing protein [Acetatifactor sp.]
MVFCTNCGKKVSAGVKFCPECGTPISNEGSGERKQVFEGSVHKCPNCGEPIKAFSTKCSACGYEFREAPTSATVKEFARQLQEIESKRKGKSKLSSVAEAFGVKAKDTTDEQKINLIRNFSVPNSKEDVLEFMILASSNIDVSAYENNNDPTAKDVSNAWIAKTDQVYQKAKLSFWYRTRICENTRNV